jgi:hypothetical protein
LIVEIVGPDMRDTTMIFTLLSAVATVPVLDMIRLNGVGFSKFGTRGPLWTSALANLVVIAVFVTERFRFQGCALIDGLRNAHEPSGQRLFLAVF